MSKKEIRKNFRDVCLKRDKNTCVMCGKRASSKEEALEIFDIHHVTDRHDMPNGGYCLENGITLCKNDCHLKAEIFHSTGTAHPGFSPDDLYGKIGSSFEKAKEASEKLKS
jgi:hypothetical protein